MGTKILGEMQLQLRQALRGPETPQTSGAVPKATKMLDDVTSVDNSVLVSFEDLSYSVRPWLLSNDRKELLNNLCGEFRPGELTAIMGLSGAGKSTLIDILAGFITANVTGNILINSRARDVNEFRRSCAYIMQNDNLQPLLTVDEAMSVAADLKLTKRNREKKQTIDQILMAMSLDRCRHTRTGLLSGGERKRLAIALELINSPPIMFLDEPTSGLDSVTSKHCLTLLKQLAKSGQTIVCSIHQPSASMLNLLDHMYVVADGQCVYTGSSQNLVPYLSNLGLQCPTHYNPADFLMEICNGDYGKHLSKMVEAIENGRSNAWRSTSNATMMNHQDEVIALSVTASFQAIRQRSMTQLSVFKVKRSYSYYPANFWRQLAILLRRNAIKLSRDKVMTFTRLSMHIIIALLVGTVYFKVGQDAVYVLDNFNLLFFNIMFLMFSAFSATITTFPSELPIVTREHFNRWYNLHSYYLANKLADFPIQFTAIILYILIVYFMSNQLLELKRFCLYTMMCFAISLVAQTAGLLLGTGMKLQNGMIFGPLVILPFLIFSGFFVHLRDAHPYLHWLFHLSFLKYGFEGVMVAIYGYDRPKLHCSDVYCYFAVPEQLLVAVDMKHADYWFCLIVLSGLYVVLDISAFAFLKLKLEKRV